MWGVTNTELGGSPGTKEGKKVTKAVIATQWKTGSFYSSDSLSLLLKKIFYPSYYMVGLKSNTMGMNIAIQAEASHFSYIPCSICGLRNLSRNKRKAEGINLEEAAACQLLTNNWIHI